MIEEIMLLQALLSQILELVSKKKRKKMNLLLTVILNTMMRTILRRLKKKKRRKVSFLIIGVLISEFYRAKTKGEIIDQKGVEG